MCRWTHELIPEINRWIKRDHIEFIYDLQTGHGSFKFYLDIFHLTDDEVCKHCNSRKTMKNPHNLKVNTDQLTEEHRVNN